MSDTPSPPTPPPTPPPHPPADPHPYGAGNDLATGDFLAHRPLLFSIVYNMLGSVTDTEDVLQDTWLSWAARRGGRRPAAGADTSADAGSGEIANPRAYLVRVAVNAALAKQAALSRRRETYVGPWLPEPLVTEAPDERTTDPADPAMRAESVSMALMVVLETLSPLERAVFILHEVFGYAHTEIAGILDRSPAAVRQLGHRAREHVQARRPRFHTDRRVRQAVTERFLAAALGGDLDALLGLLAPDVTLWTDGGGKSRASTLRPIQGRENVARLIKGVTSRRHPDGLDVRYRTVNGDPSAVLFADDAPFAVMVVDLTSDGDHVAGIYAVTNPDKLSRIDAEEEAPEDSHDNHDNLDGGR